jgi:zinc transport system substrate-binding protein/manganese/iron transport system substrate-binding protein
MKMFRRALLAFALLTSLGLVLGQTKLRVVVTIHPYYDIVRQIGGDLIDATRLLPVGASPHSYEPSPQAVLRISQADLLIRNGGTGLDEWLLPLINASGTKAPLLSIMDSISFTPLGTSHRPHGPDAPDHDGEHEEDAEQETAQDGAFVNPHIWLDATIMMSAAQVISSALSEIDPANAASYRANTELLLAGLAALDQDLLVTLEPVRGAAFVPFHDAWPYFADRYGLNLVVEIEPFPGREPSPDYLLYALALIRETDAKAIFSERQLSPRPAAVVAEAAGLPLYILDPEGGGASDVETYQELLRFNAAVILEALGTQD